MNYTKLFLLSFFFLTSFSYAAPSCSNNQVGGTVYRDFNYNGLIDSTEPIVTGVEVAAYSSIGSVIDSTVVSSQGEYVLNVASGTSYRLEFTNIPSYLNDGAVGGDSNGRVRHLNADGSCDNDLLLSNPNQYCGEDPTVITPCFIAGPPNPATDSGDGFAIATFPYSRTGQFHTPLGFPDPGYVAPDDHWIASSVGALWGITYDVTRGVVFASAFHKAHSGFGPLGPGGIYAIDPTNPTPAGVTAWLDLNSLVPGIAGTDTHTFLPGDDYVSSWG